MRTWHQGRGWRAALPALAAIAMVLATPTPVASSRWWRSPDVVAQLRLSPRQVASIDRIYESMSSESVVCAQTAAAARASLDRLFAQGAADDVLGAAASTLAEADAAKRRTRLIMLYRMFRELSPEQRDALARIARVRQRAHDENTSP